MNKTNKQKKDIAIIKKTLREADLMYYKKLIAKNPFKKNNKK